MTAARVNRSQTTARVRSSFRHVLCPVDFSPHSRNALRYAVALARRNDSRLTVLFVNDPLLGAAAAAAAYDTKALAAATDAELRRFVARALGKSPVKVDHETAFGHAAPQIQKASTRLGADVVVMGSRGLTGAGKWFFGSTTEQMLRAATVPVLVVPQPGLAKGPWHKSLRTWPGKQVVVAVDIDDNDASDVRVAVDLVRALNATPMLLHAVPPARFPSWLKVDAVRHDRARLDAARRALEALAGTLGGDIACQIVVGDPAEAIAAEAARQRAGLIVLTLQRPLSALGPRQGSITYQVLAMDVAPVLAIPAGGSTP